MTKINDDTWLRRYVRPGTGEPLILPRLDNPSNLDEALDEYWVKNGRVHLTRWTVLRSSIIADEAMLLANGYVEVRVND